MIESQETDLSKLERFTDEPYRLVEQLWGEPLLVGLHSRLRFEKTSPAKVRLTILDADKSAAQEIEMDYIAEQLCATHKEIDLIFRFREDGSLAFDQDHEDNGAPSNGGSTGNGLEA